MTPENIHRERRVPQISSVTRLASLPAPPGLAEPESRGPAESVSLVLTPRAEGWNYFNVSQRFYLPPTACHSPAWVYRQSLPAFLSDLQNNKSPPSLSALSSTCFQLETCDMSSEAENLYRASSQHFLSHKKPLLKPKLS